MTTSSVFGTALASWVDFHCEVRVSVVMVDKSLQEQYFIAETPIFLPAEVFLGLLEFKDHVPNQSLRTPRFASIYSYDFELFRQRFLGQPGAAWLEYVAIIYGLCVHACCVYYMLLIHHLGNHGVLESKQRPRFLPMPPSSF